MNTNEFIKYIASSINESCCDENFNPDDYKADALDMAGDEYEEQMRIKNGNSKLWTVDITVANKSIKVLQIGNNETEAIKSAIEMFKTIGIDAKANGAQITNVCEDELARNKMHNGHVSVDETEEIDVTEDEIVKDKIHNGHVPVNEEEDTEKDTEEKVEVSDEEAEDEKKSDTEKTED